MSVGPQKPKIEPVVIHDVVRSRRNLWPWAIVLLCLLVVMVSVSQKRRNTAKIVEVSHDQPNYVISDEPLFQGKPGMAPKLAKTASIMVSALPELPKKSAAAPAEDPTPAANDTAEDPNDVGVTQDRRLAAIELTEVQLASQNDGDGHEIAYGTAAIYNPSAFEVTNFELYLATTGGTYRLVPFTGSPENPVPITLRTIPPGGRITLPIMSSGIYTAGDPGAAKTVSIEATEHGATVQSHVTVN